jgi:GNAT superfamily N-acetyltransferase
VSGGQATTTDLEVIDFQIHEQLDRDTIAALWPRYERGFAELRTKAAARMVMHCHEFEQQMRDPRILKYVARHHGDPVGLATLATDLRAVDWISPEFYAARFPERYAEGRIYYLGWLTIDPAHRQRGLRNALLRYGVERVVTDGAMVVYDTCRYNEDAVRFTETLNAYFGAHGLGQVRPVDEQLYYAWVPFSDDL